MLRHSIVSLGGYTYCLFPWLGTRSFRTLRKMIGAVSGELGISGMDYEGCCYMTFRMERGDPTTLLRTLMARFGEGGVSAHALVAPSELPTFDKYDAYIPGDLLRHAYAEDHLDTAEATMRLHGIMQEFS